MAHLLYSAKRADGKAVQGFVEAATVALARQELMGKGLVEIAIHQDALISQDPEELAGLSRSQIEHLARLKLQAMRTPGLLPVLAEVARRNRFWLLIDAGMLVWGLYVGSWVWVSFGLLLIVLPFAFATWNFRHGDRYVQLLKSHAVGDWARVEELAAKLRAISTDKPLIDFELDLKLASIKARRGELTQALADLELWRSRLMSTPGLYESRVATVFASGEDRDGCVRLMGEAYELAGRDPVRTADYALMHARFGSAARAAELLASVDAALLPPHAAGFLKWTAGVCRLRERQPDALALLGQAVAELLKISEQPAVWTSLALCTCDHAVALGIAGNKEQARRELAQVWPIVKAHADKPLIRMLQADGLAPN